MSTIFAKTPIDVLLESEYTYDLLCHKRYYEGLNEVFLKTFKAVRY